MSTHLPRLRSAARLTASLALSAGLGLAQCVPQWQPGDPVATPRGNVRALVQWDPDGAAGPLPLQLVAAGRFAVGGASDASVARFDGTAWTPFGDASLGVVTAATVFNGDLVVASSTGIRRWNGAAWQSIGTLGVTAGAPSVNVLSVFQGQLVAGGRFATVNGATVNNLAAWNGSIWSGMAGGTDGPVHALASFPFQNQTTLWVGGEFANVGGASRSNLALWSGSGWVVAGNITANGAVYALAPRFGTTAGSTFLLVGGAFSFCGSVVADRVARFTPLNGGGYTWAAQGGMTPGGPACRRLGIRSSGFTGYEVVAAEGSQLWRTNGTTWNQLGADFVTTLSGSGGVRLPVTIDALTWFGGRWTVGMVEPYGSTDGVWAYTGSEWRAVLGEGIDADVQAVLADGPDVVIGGGFRSISGVVVDGIARGGPGAWQPIGGGLTGGAGAVLALARLPGGDLVAGGTFSLAQGGAADRIARWDGTAWQPLAGGMNGTVRALAVMPNGDLVAGGSFTFAGQTAARNVARWNGSVWSDLDLGVSSEVRALLALPDGDVVVGGSFVSAGSSSLPVNSIARFGGGAWHAFGSVFGQARVVDALALSSRGEILAGGGFGPSAATAVVRWLGTTWSPLAGLGITFRGSVRSLCPLPNGDVLVGGDSMAVIEGSFIYTDHLVRWRGGNWEPLGVGRALGTFSADSVHSVAVAPDGDLWIGGAFQRVAATVSARVAQLTLPCPATAVSYGAGCAGAGGLDEVVPLGLPWLGAPFRTRVTGLPNSAVSAAIYGFSQSAVPLRSLTGLGVVGCTLWTPADIAETALPVGGTFTAELFLPVQPAFVGVPFYHQVLTLEFGPGQPGAVTSTNGLALVVGTF